MTGADDRVVSWLLDGDPAIRWQVLRDLTGAPREEVDAERRLVATTGWGARLLELQDPDGRWAGALYSPKWTSTTYTLLMLHWLGLPPGHPQALAGCRQLWEGATYYGPTYYGATYYGGGLTFAKSIHQPETCITAMLVLLASSFEYADERTDPAVEWMLSQQLHDGGWNCETVRSGSEHGSFHTSISALDALVEYQAAGGRIPVADAMTEGRRFFLDHRLWHSHRTGQEVDRAFRRFPFPPQWHFDVLRGLEHFWRTDAARDERLQAGIDLVRGSQRRDGTWPLHRGHPGRTWFRMEEPGPSRWSTLRARRVLAWWDHKGPGHVATLVPTRSRPGPRRSG